MTHGKQMEKNKDMANWWPTIVKTDFDINAYIKNMNAKIMVKVLP